MKVSIIVPVYNKSSVIGRCIESIRCQTFYDFEVLLIDDGSTDDSYKIMKNIAIDDPRIIVIHQKNTGPGAARNKGISLAKGDYLLFVDADDSIEKNMIETMINSCNDLTDVVICGYKEYSPDFAIERLVKESDTVLNSHGFLELVCKWKDSPIIGAPWNKLYRTVLIRENQILFPTRQTWGEDLLFNIDVYKRANTIRIISQCLYNYTRGEASLSKTNHLRYSYEIDEFWRLKKIAYEKMRVLLLDNSASYDQLIQLKELEIEYIYSVIHLKSLGKGVSELIKFIRTIQDTCDIRKREKKEYIKYFSRKNYLRSRLICCSSIAFIAAFEKVFYRGVRIVRQIHKSEL